MTKQEEIREVLGTLCAIAKVKDLTKSPTGYDDEIENTIRELDELGLVIKVDRELPYKKCKKCNGQGSYIFLLPDDVGSPNRVWCDKCNGTGNSNAGYVAVEPLIQENTGEG